MPAWLYEPQSLSSKQCASFSVEVGTVLQNPRRFIVVPCCCALPIMTCDGVVTIFLTGSTIHDNGSLVSGQMRVDCFQKPALTGLASTVFARGFLP